MTVLDEILVHKRDEVAARKATRSQSEVAEAAQAATAPRGFQATLEARVRAGQPAVIAEVKKASPSKGVIRTDFDPGAIAQSYADGGAACLSVLTDERYFQGADDYLVTCRSRTNLPVLRKDFVVDTYQLYEARALGADCILLIVSALTDAELAQFAACTRELGMDALIEVHDAAELTRALALNPTMVGINNRNLKTFETTIETTINLLASVPTHVLPVTESGIHTRADVQRLTGSGVGAYLVGEAFMRADDPGRALAELFATADPSASDASNC